MTGNKMNNGMNKETDKEVIAKCIEAVESLRDCNYWYDPYEYDDQSGIETYEIYQDSLSLLIVALKQDTPDIEAVGRHLYSINDAMSADIWADDSGLDSIDIEDRDAIFIAADQAGCALSLMTGLIENEPISRLGEACQSLIRT